MEKTALILSDMLETGQSSKLLYRQVAELVHSRGVEKIVGVGEEIRTAAARFEIEKYFFRTTEELLVSSLFRILFFFVAFCMPQPLQSTARLRPIWQA